MATPSTPLNWFMEMVFTLDDIKLIRLVLDHRIIQSYHGPPLIGYSSHLVGLETFKQMVTIPRLQDRFFDFSANTLEKVQYMHKEMAYQFTAWSLTVASLWYNREVFYYVLDHIVDKSPGFLNKQVSLLYVALQGEFGHDTRDRRFGRIDILEHLVEQRYLTVLPAHNPKCYGLVQSKLLRTLSLDPLCSGQPPQQSNTTTDDDDDDNNNDNKNLFSNVLSTTIYQASNFGMIDTLQDIVETYWPIFKINKNLARECLTTLLENASNTHHLIVRLFDIVVEITPMEALKLLADGNGGGVETTLYLLNKQLVGKETIQETDMVEILNAFVYQGHLEEFIQTMKFLHQHNNKYTQLLHQLVNKVDIMEAAISYRNPFIHYYMRLHYLYKDAGHRRRSFINMNNNSNAISTGGGGGGGGGHQRRSSQSNTAAATASGGGGGSRNGSPLISSQIPSSLLPNLLIPNSSMIPPLFLNPTTATSVDHNNNNNNNNNNTQSLSSMATAPSNLSQSSPNIITPTSVSTSSTPNLTLSSHAIPTTSSSLSAGTTNNNNNNNTIAAAPETLVIKTKGANTEVYGFVYWIATILGYVIYLLWAFIPEHVLSDLGVHYYPSKYWAIAIPMYIIVCIIFGMTVYFSINLIITKPFDSFNTYKDEFTQTESDTHVYLPESIPPLEDLPLDIINKILYQTRSNNYNNSILSGGRIHSLVSSGGGSSTSDLLLPHHSLSQQKTTTLSNLSLSPLNTQSISTSTSGVQPYSPTTSPTLTGIRQRGALSSSTSSTKELIQQQLQQQSPSTSSPRSHYLPLLSHFNSPLNSGSNLGGGNNNQSPSSNSSNISSSNNNSDQEFDSNSSSSSRNSSPSSSNSSSTTMRRVNTLPTINSSSE
ncbi:hypothetical protein DFA_03930 [Cavenderia fasciculata]|uniref:PIG-P domain-containing protein n=1 Tax=Cavenderia fasciculata TaxID=261658 RepID=F4Q0T5_CACFS|nr:uncharacterized protein DFA_03930 [Cavenderia fasciculata]EGG18436.1 hypothetical protein DFA_03930 [Cavenderia fasciculata]|eukprot:XP_004366340.1 hypothetical protein DFA_03930 [Cavenderia fasciculata]